MRNFMIGAAALLATALLFPAAAQAGDAVGKVAELQGLATITHGGQTETHKLVAGDAILQNDTVQTAENSRVRILFIDNTDMVVAQHGKMTVDTYVFDPKNQVGNKAQFSILGAAFSYVGGLMDKGKNPDVKMNLDFGSIGIRGTTLYRSMHKGECWIFLEKGAVSVYNKQGEVHLTSGEGTIMSMHPAPPAKPHTWTPKEIDWIKGTVANPWTHPKDWK